MSLNIIVNYLEKNRCYQSNQKRVPIGIQLHTIGTGQGTAQAVADYWNQAEVSACVTYIVDCDTPGKVLQCLPENVRSWADAGYGNGHLITFEICESDYIRYTSGAQYNVLNKEKVKADIMRGYETAVELCADICRRYGWDPETKLPSGLYLISSHDEGRRAGLSSAHVDPTHVWNPYGLTMDEFRKAVKKMMQGENKNGVTVKTEPDRYYRIRKTWGEPGTQIGAYTSKENAMDACIPGYTVYDWDGIAIYKNIDKTTGTQTAEFEGLSETQAASRLLEICRPIAEKNGLLPSVCAAQTILESGYCTTELAKKANNVCGMKTNLSGNTWLRSTWDGKSKVNIRTAEQDKAGNVYYVYTDFRKYQCIEDSISDRCAYLLTAKNGEAYRYPDITKAKDYKDQIALIKAGGYATDVKYVEKIKNIIEKFKLNVCDPVDSTEKDIIDKVSENAALYFVQAGVFKSKTNAQNMVAKIKKQKVDAAISQEEDQYVVQAGVFEMKENADRIVKKLRAAGISAIIKEIDAVKKPATVGDAVAEMAHKLADIMIAKKWVYSNKGNKMNFEDAGKAKKPVSNCALFASHVLQETGHLNKNQTFYFNKLGKAVSRKNAWKRLAETCDIIMIEGKPAETLRLKRGDILGYADQHTNIFDGYATDGSLKWIDAGRGGTQENMENSPFTKKIYKRGSMSGFKVMCIIRPK